MKNVGDGHKNCRLKITEDAEFHHFDRETGDVLRKKDPFKLCPRDFDGGGPKIAVTIS